MSKQQKPATAIPEATSTSLFNNPRLLGWLLAIVSFALYSGTIGHGFVLDDIAVVQQNRFVHEGFGGIADIFSTFYWEGYWSTNAGLYRPLSLVMFAIEWAISPENPQIHHFMNVLTYVLCIVLLFKLLRRLFAAMPPVIPFLIALLFALHPIHTEVVANIKSRDELLCFLFFVLMLLQLSQETITRKNLLLAGLFFFLSLLSKEAAVLFFPIVLLYLLLIRKFSIRQLTPTVLSLGAIAIVWFCIHQAVIRTSPTEPAIYTYHDNSLVACGKSEQIATGIDLFGRYAEKSVWPAKMTYDYSFDDIPCLGFGSPIVWTVLLALAVLLFFCWKWRNDQPWLLFGLLFFIVTISLATNIFSLIGATFAERLLFTPVLGTLIFLICGAYALSKRYPKPTMNNILIAVGALVGIGYAGLTFSRNPDWESNEKLFEAGARVGSRSARVHANYGTVLMQQAQQLPEGTGEDLYNYAIGELNRAVAIDSNDASALINLGVCYYHVDKFTESIAATSAANKLNSSDTTLFFNLADAYYASKNFNDAATWYEKGIRSPDKTKLGDYERLGTVYFEKQEFRKAIDVFALGLKRFPDQENLLMNTANCYGAMNDFKKSAETFYAVYQLNPSNKKALEMMRMSEARGGIKVTK